jgi:hypothetical protein
MPMVQLTLMSPYGHPQGLPESVTFDQKMAENQQNLKSRVKDLFLCKHVLFFNNPMAGTPYHHKPM